MPIREPKRTVLIEASPRTSIDFLWDRGIGYVDRSGARDPGGGVIVGAEVQATTISVSIQGFNRPRFTGAANRMSPF